ncbi:Protein CBG08472 [Caenorhabditis briggsae]|uniref:Protein CBG08472 n=1 Tax=Caenorhabditis briggsae TaxID=6238 RepID=A8X6M7_CAEBR|nr:Protein CBG08472 [Caenorhabditis briggsae]CAP28288.1 Protein CBG08472 [Caenorhabditis briggsae]
MAPPTPFKARYDPELKKHVVEVRSKDTGEIMKFTYNLKFKTFEAAGDPIRVYERDLIPIYQKDCERHITIWFCRNNKYGGKVYKYTARDMTNPWTRVQCLCCDFVEADNKVDPDAQLLAGMNLDEMVDDSDFSYLWIQPVFSKFCEVTSKMAVFASVFPDVSRLVVFNFDAGNQKFVRSICDADCCMEIRNWDGISPAAFDFGSQGQHYSRTHRDQMGRRLMALDITWYNTEHGRIEHFVDSDGDIGKYEWNEACECHDLVEQLEVRTMSHRYPSEIEHETAEVLYDNELYLLNTKNCSSLRDKIYFCWHINDGETQKYVFDSTNLQFALVKCPCCTYSYDDFNPMSNPIATYSCAANNTQSASIRVREREPSRTFDHTQSGAYCHEAVADSH